MFTLPNLEKWLRNHYGKQQNGKIYIEKLNRPPGSRKGVDYREEPEEGNDRVSLK